MEQKSIIDSINLTENPSLTFPVKAETDLELRQTDSLATTLSYLSKTYNENIWKSSSKNDPHQNKHRVSEIKSSITDFKSGLFCVIELVYGYSVIESYYAPKIDFCPHLLSMYTFISNFGIVKI